MPPIDNLSLAHPLLLEVHLDYHPVTVVSFGHPSLSPPSGRVHNLSLKNPAPEASTSHRHRAASARQQGHAQARDGVLTGKVRVCDRQVA